MTSDEWAIPLPADLFEIDLSEGTAWIAEGSWFEYAQGFRQSARDLTDLRTGAEPTGDPTAFVILFLYRHYLELTMKAFIQGNRPNAGEAPSYPPTHSLVDLWTGCEKILGAWQPGRYSQEIAAARAQIHLLHQVDPLSTSFRYPESKKRVPSIQEPARVSVKYFADQIEKIGDLLEGWDTGIYEEAQNRKDARETPC